MSQEGKKIIKDNNHPRHCLFKTRYHPEGEVSTAASKQGQRD
jgi:hypothetical protein